MMNLVNDGVCTRLKINGKSGGGMGDAIQDGRAKEMIIHNTDD